MVNHGILQFSYVFLYIFHPFQWLSALGSGGLEHRLHLSLWPGQGRHFLMSNLKALGPQIFMRIEHLIHIQRSFNLLISPPVSFSLISGCNMVQPLKMVPFMGYWYILIAIWRYLPVSTRQISQVRHLHLTSPPASETSKGFMASLVQFFQGDRGLGAVSPVGRAVV